MNTKFTASDKSSVTITGRMNGVQVIEIESSKDSMIIEAHYLGYTAREIAKMYSVDKNLVKQIIEKYEEV